LTVDANGLATGVAQGTATVTVTDSTGAALTSLDYNVGPTSSSTPPGGGDCPLGDPAMCEMLCGIMPDLPFCNK
jgi:thermitase